MLIFVLLFQLRDKQNNLIILFFAFIANLLQLIQSLFSIPHHTTGVFGITRTFMMNYLVIFDLCFFSKSITTTIFSNGSQVITLDIP